MKKIALSLACAVLILPGAAFAQNITIPERIEKLSASATDSVNITLDGPLLQLATAFLNSNDKDQATAKNLISKLKSISVRTFEFDRRGMYSDADLDAIRAQLKSPQWTRIVDSKEKDEHTQIFVRQDKGAIAGFVILSAESRELSIVSIDGQIDLNQLSKLGGHFGVPKIDAPSGSAKDSAE